MQISFRWLWIVVVAALFCAGAEAAWAENKTCGEGDEAVICGERQHCCEHVVATFCPDQSCGYSYKQGRCVDDAVECGDFWCGTQHCQANWFNSAKVCCVYHDAVNERYKCTPSELNCPGNSQRLTIRDSARVPSS